MKNLLFITIFTFFIFNKSYSAEIIDCKAFDKLRDKIECKAKNLKSNLNEKQTKIKSKIENIDETEAGIKFKKTKLGQKLFNFKNSKTGSDFLKKE